MHSLYTTSQLWLQLSNNSTADTVLLLTPRNETQSKSLQKSPPAMLTVLTKRANPYRLAHLHHSKSSVSTHICGHRAQIASVTCIRSGRLRSLCSDTSHLLSSGGSLFLALACCVYVCSSLSTYMCGYRGFGTMGVSKTVGVGSLRLDGIHSRRRFLY